MEVNLTDELKAIGQLFLGIGVVLYWIWLINYCRKK